MPYIILKSNEFGKDVEISLPYAHGNVANDRLIPSELRCHLRPAYARPYVLVPPVGTRTVRATTTAAETLSLLERNGWKVIGMAGISSNAVQTDAHLVWTMWKEGSRE
ncbi:hypothetical protein Tcan_08136 [Toxocara canis]|uniref:GTP cyclohydrolase 1 feedback regulatory protein n=1 Tax=Toxocara canis TaxID=6265 RepID=A0A0B2VVW8_TOXCA|nr:hypothetical protein Tcan_08136 [Toxocara canis]